MLSNIKILDLSVTLPGPYCTQMLASFGGEVIKVERPDTGDIMRETDPWLFKNINCGKKSIDINLKTSEGRNVIYSLVKDVDVVIEGFRPGVVKRLGVDYETLKQINPKIIYCSISGFGQEGPYRNLPGHDINYMALSGALAMTGNIETDPEEGHVQKIPISDFTAGLFAANAILAALASKEQKGIYIDVSMMDIMVTWASLKSGSHFTDSGLNKSIREAHYGVFKTKDCKYVALGIVEDHFWQKICGYFEWEDFLDNSEMKTYQGRNKYSDKILPRLRAAIAGLEQSDLIRDLGNLGIPCSPIQSLKEVKSDPHVQYRELFGEGIDSIGQKYVQLKIPYQFKGYYPISLERAPVLGEHTFQIVNSLEK
jgi:crotonobetainyl-CoA:carnitine CoA-transferase CaiB-like acyl-CoA transferase